MCNSNSLSPVWRELKRLQSTDELFEILSPQSFKWNIGKGTQILFWYDIWVGVSKLRDQFPALFRLSGKKNEHIADMVIFSENGLMWWDIGILFPLNEYEDLQYQMLMSLLRNFKVDLYKEDEVQWTHSLEKVSSVAEGVRVMVKSHIDFEFDRVKVVWNKLVPSKISTFHWLAIQGGIPVKEVLSYRNCLNNSSDDKCAWCLDHIESIDHILLHYSWSHKVWTGLFKWWNIFWVVPSNVLEFSVDWSNGMGIKAEKVWKLIGSATFWAIWLARNEVIFNGSYTCWAVIVSRIKLKVFQWLVNAKVCESFQLYVWSDHPWLLLQSPSFDMF
ncbi:uncharacterized protein [Rutidosis leptorrhynchoides]|uniref:uncharacterized protein n=1 Tax=Rutidosis leptorrhynchoides TaxID=125765 RepID=UPI003A9938B0